MVWEDFTKIKGYFCRGYIKVAGFTNQLRTGTFFLNSRANAGVRKKKTTREMLKKCRKTTYKFFIKCEWFSRILFAMIPIVYLESSLSGNEGELFC